MITKMIRQTRRRMQRADARCMACGQKGTTDTPLMFVADTNGYWHYPYCMPRSLMTEGEKKAIERSTS